MKKLEALIIYVVSFIITSVLIQVATGIYEFIFGVLVFSFISGVALSNLLKELYNSHVSNRIVK